MLPGFRRNRRPRVNIKELASSVKKLTQDETFRFIITSIKVDQSAIFLNPHSSTEDREKAHKVICGLAEIENFTHRVISDEKVFDHKHR